MSLPRPAWLRAALLYFALVFTLGTLLGVLRVTVMIPRLGELRAVLVELPVMLVASWFLCRAVLRRIEVGRALRLPMGAAFFLALMAAELALAFLAGRIPGSELAPAQLLGLGAQMLTALFPRLQAAR